ncbi:S-formylglutathione hydrolase [Candidatus Sororendozoicomonas aggregata]|uniref:S-formylglutathione hydrolase n=1 Tax=Candidatus Sororendozoicomonas aggregata TaxID=3073239 RepID=UPI002ED240BA
MLTLSCRQRCFGGWHERLVHASDVLSCEMRFAIYLPPFATKSNPVPVLFWLSGLTCTDENFMQKAGALRVAAELGLAIVAPDTSPRGEGVPDAPDGAYDLGLGAGFYVNATEAPWSKHYRMYDYVVTELPALVEQHFPVSSKRAISGHSMGGHGAMMIALRNPGVYSSVSAFSPICHPVKAPWGKKAFSNYLGDDRAKWEKYDTIKLLRESDIATVPPLMVDQGGDDEFLNEQLMPESLVVLAKEKDVRLDYRLQSGYDHGYYFVTSFIEEHLNFHYACLQGGGV